MYPDFNCGWSDKFQSGEMVPLLWPDDAEFFAINICTQTLSMLGLPCESGCCRARKIYVHVECARFFLWAIIGLSLSAVHSYKCKFARCGWKYLFRLKFPYDWHFAREVWCKRTLINAQNDVNKELYWKAYQLNDLRHAWGLCSSIWEPTKYFGSSRQYYKSASIIMFQSTFQSTALTNCDKTIHYSLFITSHQFNYTIYY